MYADIFVIRVYCVRGTLTVGTLSLVFLLWLC